MYIFKMVLGGGSILYMAFLQKCQLRIKKNIPIVLHYRDYLALLISGTYTQELRDIE